MARSAKATEQFTLPIIRQQNARGESSVVIPGYLRCKRTYTGGTDSMRGDWIQLCPGLMFTPKEYMVSAHKDGRRALSQFEDVEILDDYPFKSRFDYKG